MSTASAVNAGTAQTAALTNSPASGFDIAAPAANGASSSTAGKFDIATLGARVSAEHMPAGVDGPMLLYKASGVNLSQPVQLTLPNTSGLPAGAVVGLLAMNPQTGGHDVVGQMIVSADGQTLTSLGTVLLAKDTAVQTGAAADTGGGSLGGGSRQAGSGTGNGSGAKAAANRNDNGGGSLGGGSGVKKGAKPDVMLPGGAYFGGSASSTSWFGSSTSWLSATSWSVSTTYNTSSTWTYQGCLILEMTTVTATQYITCPTCAAKGAATLPPANNTANSPSPASTSGSGGWAPQSSGTGDTKQFVPQLNSDANLLTGAYLLDH